MARESIIGFGEFVKMKKIVEEKKTATLQGHYELAQKTVDVMKSFIIPHRRGSTGNLAQSISDSVEVDKDGIFVGIGDVQKMFAMAPYWYVVNYGSKWPGSLDAVRAGVRGTKFIPPPNLGFFSDGKVSAGKAGKGQAQWGHTGIQGNDLLVPKTFRPINYIEKTQAWLNINYKKFWLDRL